MNRRDFIKKSALAAGALGIAPVVDAMEKIPTTPASSEKRSAKDDDKANGRLIDSAPVLENYAETSMGIAFSVTAKANGFVLYSERPDLSDARKVYCGGFRMTDMNDEVMLVRLTGLKPATTYYYKIGADRIHYGGGYDMKILGTETDDTVYSFTTAGKNAKAHFCVINDTHAHWDTFDAIVKKLAVLAPSCVVWNGDACNSEETVEAQKRIFLNPPIETRGYAANTPYLFCMGNHDFRGLANRHLERVWMYRQPDERSGRDWDLGRNFAVRMGDVALVGLDTGEDKQDTNPRFANLFASEPYRVAQTAWLADALKRKDIASAPYLVAFCHIPLYDDQPRSNPGDIRPADKDPRYDGDFANWQRFCAQQWTPLLEKAHCQLLITAHQHHYRCLPATKGRPWTEIIGGGPTLKGETDYPTVIEGSADKRQLLIKVHNIKTGNVDGEFSFKPRKV